MIFPVGMGQAAAKPRRPTIGVASIGGPALAFARWSHPTFCRSTSLGTRPFLCAELFTMTFGNCAEGCVNGGGYHGSQRLFV